MPPKHCPPCWHLKENPFLHPVPIYSEKMSPRGQSKRAPKKGAKPKPYAANGPRPDCFVFMAKSNWHICGHIHAIHENQCFVSFCSPQLYSIIHSIPFTLLSPLPKNKQINWIFGFPKIHRRIVFGCPAVGQQMRLPALFMAMQKSFLISMLFDFVSYLYGKCQPFPAVPVCQKWPVA